MAKIAEMLKAVQILHRLKQWWRMKLIQAGKEPWGRTVVNSKQKVTVEAVVIRKDGTREDLGVISRG